MAAPLRNSLSNQGTVIPKEDWLQGQGLKWATGVNQMEKCDAVTDNVDAIALYDAKTGIVTSVQFAPGWCGTKLGGAVAAGGDLKIDTDGDFIAGIAADVVDKQNYPVVAVAAGKSGAHSGPGFLLVWVGAKGPNHLLPFYLKRSLTQCTKATLMKCSHRHFSGMSFSAQRPHF